MTPVTTTWAVATPTIVLSPETKTEVSPATSKIEPGTAGNNSEQDTPDIEASSTPAKNNARSTTKNPRLNKTVIVSSATPIVAVTSSGTKVITYTSISYVLFPTILPASEKDMEARQQEAHMAHTSAVVGGCVGVVLFLGLLALGCFLLKRRRKRRDIDIYMNTKGDDSIFYTSPLHENYGDYRMEDNSMNSKRPTSMNPPVSGTKQVRAFVAPPSNALAMEGNPYIYPAMAGSPALPSNYYEDVSLHVNNDTASYGYYQSSVDVMIHHQGGYASTLPSACEQPYYLTPGGNPTMTSYYPTLQERHVPDDIHSDVPHSKD
ncbi:hypothetical protein BDF14DRAFT_1882317 [Spinellus fusiger]|nr:hypothetical protein BDF14DRAFT_1882317 [Spinellus fusiger]